MRLAGVVLTVSLCLPVLALGASRGIEVHTYPCADNSLRSSRYIASLGAGAGSTPAETCVYALSSDSRAGYPGVSLGGTVSWASFAYNGSGVTVRVRRVGGWGVDPSSVVVHPRSAGVSVLPISGDTVELELPSNPLSSDGRTKGLKLSVHFKGQVLDGAGCDVLLIFADPPEDLISVPDSSSPSTMFFGPGVHNIGGQMPLPRGITSVYLAPGAWVDGGLITTDPEAAVSVTGRGVLSGHTFPFLPDPAGQQCSYNLSFCWSLLNMDRGASHLVQGIVLVDPPKYYFRSYAADIALRNVKFAVAWPYNTDGVVTGPRGYISDVFIRSNDDSIKLYSADLVLRDTVVWQMANGAVFQLGWWTSHDQSGIICEDVEVIRIDNGTNEPNKALVSARITGVVNYSVSNITWRNIRIRDTGSNAALIKLVDLRQSGDNIALRGWTFDNVSWSRNATTVGSFFDTLPGQVQNFRFNNLTFGNSCAENATAAAVSTEGVPAAGLDVTFRC